MAKDDYFVIVYKILLYLYAVFKRKVVFDEKDLKLSIIKKDEINEDYLIDILKMMQEDGLIKGLVFKNAWGSSILLINDLADMRITSQGIDYLQNNSKMQKVKDFLIESIDIFASLINIVFPG